MKNSKIESFFQILKGIDSDMRTTIAEWINEHSDCIYAVSTVNGLIIVNQWFVLNSTGTKVYFEFHTPSNPSKSFMSFSLVNDEITGLLLGLVENEES